MKAKSFLKYAVYFLLFTGYFFLESRIGVRPFAIAVFMALVYCRENILILVPLYMAAAAIAAPSIEMLIISAAPCVVVIAAVFIHYKLKRKLKMLAVSIYLLLAELPLVFLETDTGYDVVNVVVSILGSEVFLYAAIIVMYAILTKNLRFRLGIDEIIAFSAVIASIGTVLFSAEIGFYNPYYTILAFSALISLYLTPSAAIPISLAMGIGGALVSGSADILALSVLYGAAVSVFDKKSRYYAGIALIAIDAIFRLTISGGAFSYYSLIAPAAGVLLFMVIPSRYLRRLDRFTVCFKEVSLSRTLINKDRKIVADKLNELSRVFTEIEDILHIDCVEKDSENEKIALSADTAARICGNCQGRNACREALGGAGTEIIISDLVAAALSCGKATILDTPPFLSSRCKKINALINSVNDAALKLRSNNERKARLNEGREMLGEQMGGVGQLLYELKGEVEKSLSFDGETEARLLSELSYANIAATDAALYRSERKNASLTISVNEADFKKEAFTEVVSAVLGTQMEVISAEPGVNGTVSAELAEAETYTVSYGERESAKSLDGVNGDRIGALKIAPGKVMLILSDGMGSGIDASLGSGFCMRLIESFYRAGFPEATVSSTVSRLLTLRGKEEFNAVDIAMIDTYTGYVDFIKFGGRESFILKSGAVEIVECGSLPIGILNDTEPMVERKDAAGGIIVMVSDGVIDVLGRDGISSIMESAKTNNPDVMAGLIMEDLMRVSSGKPADDASVLCARLVLNSDKNRRRF